MRQILEDPLNADEITAFKRLTVGIMVSGEIITLAKMLAKSSDEIDVCIETGTRQ